MIDLVSKRPGDETERTALINQTSRGGTDAVLFAAAPLGERFGATVLAGVHTQGQNDLDRDGWTDMPGYERAVVRPRVFFNNGSGRTAFVTGGFTAEDRAGGTLTGAFTPAGTSFIESLRTRRADLGALARFVGSDAKPLFGADALRSGILTVRGSAMEQRHQHRFGDVSEHDRHRTWFGEAALAVPRGVATYVAGVALQQETYRASNVRGFDYAFTIPAMFAQLDVDAHALLSISTSVRMDAHSDYGTFLNPRVSVLARRPAAGRFAGWSTRLSAGTGAFAPNPFVEETEVTGLTPVLPLNRPLNELVAERAASASLDVGAPIEVGRGRMQVNATLFGSRVSQPLQVGAIPARSAVELSRLLIVNGIGPTQTWGGELLARVDHALGEDEGDEEAPRLRVTGTYTLLRSTECNLDAERPANWRGPLGCNRHAVALTPRHALALVTMIEEGGKSRLGLENLTNVRQTRFDPLVLPERGRGGRWTTDAWTELVGFTMNGGVRFQW